MGALYGLNPSLDKHCEKAPNGRESFWNKVTVFWRPGPGPGKQLNTQSQQSQQSPPV